MVRVGASVSRVQLPVGHGGFHAGRIRLGRSMNDWHVEFVDKPSFDVRYVFDCGSIHPDALRHSLQQFHRDYGDCPEILFVSHIHADHINGIDQLLGYGAPDVLILPYLALEDLAATAIADFEECRFSASYRDYVRDPLGWWRAKGVKTIIFLEPGEDGDAAPVPPVPDRPIEGEDPRPPEIKSELPTGRLAAVLHRPRGSDPELTPANSATRDFPKTSLLAGSGSALRLEWKQDSSDAWRSADWLLVPYVHPVDTATRAAFKKALLKQLKLLRPSPKKFRTRLLEELTQKERAKELVDIYCDHFDNDHNAVSLSLYSGPGETWASHRLRGAQAKRTEWLSRIEGPGKRELGLGAAGWLSTGDAALKAKSRRLPWREFFGPYDENIRILTLPHHGSIRNFHEDVVRWRGLGYVIATTVPAQATIAGLSETLQLATREGQTNYIVDDKPAHVVTSESVRMFAP